MRKHKLNVPKGINFLSYWNNFRLFKFPYILNKQITGCGFTQWALTCPMNVILCSPRRILLENKFENYLEELETNKLNYSMYYAKNEYEKIIEVDKNLLVKDRSSINVLSKKLEEDRIQKSKEFTIKFKKDLINYYNKCTNPFDNKYCKILVTYDSFRKVKETLEELKVFDQFHVIVDEFQSIFVDSKFKADTEIEFINQLQNVNNVCYVSATPMMDDYLNEIDEFKDLPYLELDWGKLDSTRLIKPKINPTPCSRIINKIQEIIEKYRTGQWKDSDNSIIRSIGKDSKIQEIQSKEAVFYINSVKNICDIIKKCSLKQEECNILCANTDQNKEKIRKAFGVSKADFQGLGKVPKKSEMHLNKMFTLCTRTVYLGADFYSTNARSFVFSDSNIECLAVDITLDLPQILGRQRNDNNPWKNELNVYFYSTRNSSKLSKEDFDNILKNKIETTNRILKDVSSGISVDTILKLETAALVDHYVNDYISFDRHLGSVPVPKFNKLVMLSEKRAFEIQQIEFADRCSVRNTINNQFNIEDNEFIVKFLKSYESCTNFIDKMKLTCELFKLSELENEIKEQALIRIDEQVANYIRVLGVEKIESHSYIRIRLDREINKLINNQHIDLSEEIYKIFQIGERYSNKIIKSRLKTIYDSMNYRANPKASDLEEWFEIRKVNYIDEGKKINGLELIKKKEL